MAYMKDSTGRRLDSFKVGDSPPTRRWAMTICNAKGSSVQTEGSLRVPITSPVSTVKWRLHFRNYSPGTAASFTGSVNITGMWLGTASAINNSGNGNTGSLDGKVVAGTQVQVLPAFTLTDSVEYVSPWLTDPAMQIVADRRHHLSYGFVSSASAIGYHNGPTAFSTFGAGTSTLAADPAQALGITMGYNAFDAWIEYDFVGNQPTCIVTGDSLSMSSTFTQAVNAAFGTMPDRTWPAIFSELTGIPVLNASYGGHVQSSFTIAAGPEYTKYGTLGTTLVPDIAINAAGSNDIAAGNSASLVAQRSQAVATVLRGFGAKRVYGITISPRGDFDAAKNLVRNAYNDAFARATPDQFAGVIDFDLITRNPTSIDTYDATLPDGDGVHMKPMGYRRWAAAAAAIVRR